MYDPLIVDTLLTHHREVGVDLHNRGSGHLDHLHMAAPEIADSVLDSSPAMGPLIAANPDETLTLYQIAGALGGQAGIADTVNEVARHLRRLIPSSLFVVYSYDLSTDELEVAHAIGDGDAVVRGLKIPLGKRLSGWVAATRYTILNSAPALDFGDITRSVRPLLRSCLSTPLIARDHLTGVLTLSHRRQAVSMTITNASSKRPAIKSHMHL